MTRADLHAQIYTLALKTFRALLIRQAPAANVRVDETTQIPVEAIMKAYAPYADVMYDEHRTQFTETEINELAVTMARMVGETLGDIKRTRKELN